MRDTAILKNRDGDGMWTLKIEVIRQSDAKSLGTIRYNPNSPASCDAMENEIAAIQGRYHVDIIPE